MKKVVLLTAVMALALVGVGFAMAALGEESEEPTSEVTSEAGETPPMQEEYHREMLQTFMMNDLDSDGIPNCEDPDDDGDGINDSEDEYPHDHDNDGIPDSEDDDYVGNPLEIPSRMERRNHMRENRGRHRQFRGPPPAEDEP